MLQSCSNIVERFCASIVTGRASFASLALYGMASFARAVLASPGYLLSGAFPVLSAQDYPMYDHTPSAHERPEHKAWDARSAGR